jgi:hypothetical protein
MAVVVSPPELSNIKRPSVCIQVEQIKVTVSAIPERLSLGTVNWFEGFQFEGIWGYVIYSIDIPKGAMHFQKINLSSFSTLSQYTIPNPILNAPNVPPHVIHHVHVPDDPTDVSIPTISTVPKHHSPLTHHKTQDTRDGGWYQ